MLLSCAGWGLLTAWLLFLSAKGAVGVSEYSFRRLMGGPGYLLVEQLRGLSGSAREQRLQELQRRFQFPLTLVPRAGVELAPEAGVMLDNEHAVLGVSEEIAYYALDRDTLIQFGPMWGAAAMEDVLNLRVFWLTAAAATLPLPLLLLLAWRRRRSRAGTMAALGIALAQLARAPALILPTAGREWTPLLAALRQHAQDIAAMSERHKEVSQAVSHELRTPLARMRFALALLERGADDDTRRRLQERLLHDVAELESLVRASLAFARLADAPAALVREPLLLRDWLQEELDGLDGMRCHSELAIDTSVRELRGDRALLHLIVRNLLANAGAYGRTRLRLSAADHDAHSIVLHVDDDGPGVAPADRERIFEPFVRLAPHDAENSGHGLGLALARRAAHWQQGEIRVARGPLGGARFSLILPLQPD
ncbi:his Kinase A domain protein [Janthinobacterium agaricidamnosum NBRC 102515 = DSM 9628]|uniref:histidine kinase n=2 Tax=Janthinobacterium agaricidamnosum TaxID=55508 RepID=W0V9U1_9BURK|nr:his Kinase A domain protein [Janthinobacterium agaricidamnosum NBRC 102515 = DSM 9628]